MKLPLPLQTSLLHRSWLHPIGPPSVQTATLSWEQFNENFIKGITLKNGARQNSGLWLTPGNHDVSNAIGIWYPMNPPTDPDAMVNIYNMMLSPANPLSNSTYSYTTDKINYSRNIAGVHCMFVNIWPDSVARIWMETDLSKVRSSTPVILFTHDPPAIEAVHLTNPNGDHTINSIESKSNVIGTFFQLYFRVVDFCLLTLNTFIVLWLTYFSFIFFILAGAASHRLKYLVW